MLILRPMPTCCLFIAGLLAIASVARADDEQRIERAKEILKLWTDGKYKEFVAAGDEKVRSKHRLRGYRRGCMLIFKRPTQQSFLTVYRLERRERERERERGKERKGRGMRK